MAVETPNLPVNALVKQAEASFAAKMGVDPATVTITVGDPNGTNWGDKNIGEYTNLNVTYTTAGALTDKNVVEAERVKLSQMSSMKGWQWDSQYKLLTDFNAKALAATAGVDGFNKALLSAPMFKTDEAKKEASVSAPSYGASDIHVGDLGVTITLSRPAEKDVDHKPELKKLETLINDPAHNNEIKEVLRERILKNLRKKLAADGKSATEIETDVNKAIADIDKLIIKAAVEDNYQNGVRVSIRSPNQANERKSKNSDWATSDNGASLRGENPLSLLDDKVTEKNPHPDLQRTLSRAIFFDKNKQIRPEATNFLGLMDVKAALAKEFFRLGKEYPDKIPAFAEILKSQLFRIHTLDQKQPDAGPPEASMNVPAGKADAIVISLPVKRENVAIALQTIGAPEVAATNNMAVDPTAAAPAALAPTPNFTVANDTITPPIAMTTAGVGTVASNPSQATDLGALLKGMGEQAQEGPGR